MNDVSANVSNSIKEVRDIYSYVVDYTGIDSALSLSSPAEHRSSSVTEDLLRYMYKFSDDNINSMFLYIKTSDTILSKNAICDGHYYYQTNFADLNISYNEWNENLNTVSSPTFKHYYNVNTKKSEMLYMIPYTSNNGQNLVLCATFDDRLFFGNINISTELSFSDVYVSDENGNILSHYLNHSQNSGIASLDEALDSYSRKYTSISNKIYIDATAITITAVSSKTAYSNLISRTLNFALIITILCILICSCIIIYFCVKNYKPIQEFMQLLNVDDTHDEYSQIREKIRSILSKNMQLSEHTNTFNIHRRKLILAKYLFGNYSQQYIENILLANDVEFSHKYLTVCVFRISNLNELFADTAEITEERKYSELLFIIENIFTELYDVDGFSCDIIDSTGNIFCIINTSFPPERTRAVIEETMEFCINSIYDNFGIELNYTVSAMNHSPGGLSVAASEALYLLNYANMLEINSPLFYESYKNTLPSEEIFLTPDTEQTLINYISNGQDDKARTCIEDLFDRIYSASISLEHTRCILIDIASILFKIPNIDFNEIDHAKTFECIFSASCNLNEMKDFMLNAISGICSRLRQSNSIYKDKRLERLTAFIDDNFTNPEFSLNFIGNEFHLDAGYLTKQFKARNGMSIIDYVNKLRIEKAKELINESKTTGQSMDNIAIALGYTNVRTFNRVFTKIEGITPATYKKQHI